MTIYGCANTITIINLTTTMKIYAVLHHYDNGYTYEDYRYYTDTYLFETRKAASDYFWTKVTDDYEGSYELYEWELDTQNKVLIEDSVWVKCSPDDAIDDDWDKNWEEYYDDKANDILDYNLSLYDTIEYLTIREELQIEDEWLTHEGENYKLFKEMEEAKTKAEFKTLNSLLDDQLAYAQ